MELASHDSLINSDYCQIILIPKKAEDFTIRLSRALAPFFLPADAIRDTGFETWGQEKTVWVDRKFRMKEIFEEALKLKAETVLSDQVFDFVIHQPGETADSSHSYGTGANTHDSGQTGGQEDFHTLASLRIFPPVASIPRDLMADALVQPRNFLDRAIFIRTDSPLHTKTIRIHNFDFSNDGEDAKVGSERSIENSAPEDAQKVTQRVLETSNLTSEVMRHDQCKTGDKNIAEKLFKCQTCSRPYDIKSSLDCHIRKSKY